ncbi:MAG: flagellar transcriptional regulator FlhD [Betaproteobacteria bacterium]
MNPKQILAEIREANLSYLLLAQNMIRSDREQALYRLGLSEEVAEMVAGLSTAQILKIAASNMLMCRFRFDDQLVWSLLGGQGREKAGNIAGVHAAILIAGRVGNESVATA